MVPALIKYFNVVAVEPGQKLLDAVEVNTYAMRCGYFVHPDACTPDVVDFLKTQQVNLNSTFYRNWAQVEMLSELQMRILQMVHYMSTYGTDYKGETFTLNDLPEEMQFSNFKVLMPCTDRELFDRICGMLAAGVALDEKTLDLLFEQINLYKWKYSWTVDVDDVANRDAMVRLCALYNTSPKQPDKLVRFIVFKATGMTMVIKNATMWHALESHAGNVAELIGSLNDRRIEGLASVFYRYKPIFLALRKGAAGFVKKFNNAQPWEREFPTTDDRILAVDMRRAVAMINRIRRLAPKFHKPMQTGILESILDVRHSIDDIRAALDKETSPFKLVRILNYIAGCAMCQGFRTFIVRNGKVFVKQWNRPAYYPAIHYGRLYPIYQAVRGRLQGMIAANSKHEDGTPKTVLFPSRLVLAAPISEKQFLGNVPYGSSYELQKHNYIGIYWRNEWGTHDFDLWMVGADGRRLGWGADHKSMDVLFSGDMTNADPEATEVFYGKDSWPDCTIRVNRFNGKRGSKFRLFFGSEEIRDLKMNHIVNPDSINFIEELVSEESEMVIGVVADRRVYFTSVKISDHIVPGLGDKFSFETALSDRFKSCIGLRELLLESGYSEFVPDEEHPDLKPDIDLTELDKDTLIKIFAQ